jgi:hypothetical protein
MLEPVDIIKAHLEKQEGFTVEIKDEVNEVE